MPPRRIAVCLEATPKQAFASALDWPGYCRAGRDEDAALKALASYAERYAAAVADLAALPFIDEHHVLVNAPAVVVWPHLAKTMRTRPRGCLPPRRTPEARTAIR